MNNWKQKIWIHGASALYQKYKREGMEMKWNAFLVRLRELREDEEGAKQT